MPPLIHIVPVVLYRGMAPKRSDLWPLVIQQQLTHMSGRPKMQAPRHGSFFMPALASHTLAAVQKMPGPQPSEQKIKNKDA